MGKLWNTLKEVQKSNYIVRSLIGESIDILLCARTIYRGHKKCLVLGWFLWKELQALAVWGWGRTQHLYRLYMSVSVQHILYQPFPIATTHTSSFSKKPLRVPCHLSLPDNIFSYNGMNITYCGLQRIPCITFKKIFYPVNFFAFDY